MKVFQPEICITFRNGSDAASGVKMPEASMHRCNSHVCMARYQVFQIVQHRVDDSEY